MRFGTAEKRFHPWSLGLSDTFAVTQHPKHLAGSFKGAMAQAFKPWLSIHFLTQRGKHFPRWGDVFFSYNHGG